MDSFEVSITRFVTLTFSCILFGIILQVATESAVTIVNGLVSLISFTFAILLMIAVFQFLYDISLKKILPKEKRVPYLGIVIQSFLFVTLELSYLFQVFALPLLTTEGVVISIILAGMTLVSFSLFTDDLVHTIINRTFVQSLLWGIAGGSSTSILLLAIAAALRFVNIEIIDRADLFLLSGFLAGAALSAISVFQKQLRVGKCTNYVTFYSEVLANIGINQSSFLDSILLMRNDYIVQDPITTKERMEQTYPWLLIALSLLFLNISSSVNVITDFTRSNILGAIFSGLVLLFILIAVVYLLKEIVKIDTNYRKWRTLWSEFSELIKLLTMTKDAAMIELAHRALRRIEYGQDMTPDSVQLWVKAHLDDLSRTETIPSDPSKQRSLLVNLHLYEVLKMYLNLPRRHYLEVVGDLELLEKANATFSGVGSLLDDNIRSNLTLGIFYASLPYEFNLPIEIFKDITPLLLRDWTMNNELFSLSMGHLDFLESTPRMIIPKSLKWLPAILPIALWLSTILLG